MQSLIDVFEYRYDKPPLFWHPKKEEAPQGEREGPAATLGGGKFLRSALMYVRASHSPTTWQISRGPSCAPAVKKPPRGALGNTERLHSTQARCFSSLGLWSFTWISNIPTMTQPSKKRTPFPKRALRATCWAIHSKDDARFVCVAGFTKIRGLDRFAHAFSSFSASKT